MNHILIVEDELKLARLQADYLQNAGFDIDCLSNGLEVLPWLKANHTDLILLDLMLPGRDGLDICRDLRSCLEIIVSSQTIQHDPGHGNVNPSFVDANQSFVGLAETTRTV